MEASNGRFNQSSVINSQHRHQGEDGPGYRNVGPQPGSRMNSRGRGFGMVPGNHQGAPRGDVPFHDQGHRDPLHQEKMFLPASCATLNEQSLKEALMVHMPPIRHKTGANLHLGGGYGTVQRMHFYVGHDNIVSFNEAKHLVIMMVQNAVTDLQQNNANIEPDIDDDDIVLIDSIMEENSRACLPSDPLQQKQHLIQNAIANHKQFLEAQMQQVNRKQLENIDDRPSMLELLDSAVDGPEVIILEDDDKPTEEEIELKSQLEQLKKSSSILNILGNVPGVIPPPPPPISSKKNKNKLPPPVNQGPLEQFVLAPTRKINQNSSNVQNILSNEVAPPIRKVMQNKNKSIQFNLGKVPAPTKKVNQSNKTVNKIVKNITSDKNTNQKNNVNDLKFVSTDIVNTIPLPKEPMPKGKTNKKNQSANKKGDESLNATALPPPPLIDPALDYLYNPSVVEPTNQTTEDGGKDDLKSENTQSKKKSASEKFQVGYLPDIEYGEEPYSELLRDDENSQANEKEIDSVISKLPTINTAISSAKAVILKVGNFNDISNNSGAVSRNNINNPEEGYKNISNRSSKEEARPSARGPPYGREGRKSLDEYSSRPHDNSNRRASNAHRKQSYGEDQMAGYRRHSIEENSPPPEDPVVIIKREKRMREREIRNYERRERESEVKERKGREERRNRFDRMVKDGWFEDLKKEREKWENDELKRVGIWEQDKKYIPSEELDKSERREEDRRDRFEKERNYWLKKESEELKRQLKEELDEETHRGERRGTPLLYVSSVCPVTSQSSLHQHFSRFGPVNKVVLIRTRVKNVLQAEVYFDKWSHTKRVMRAPSGAHYLDGYHMQISYEKFEINCPITRMDEFKVDRKEESFDEILLKYKMQAELKKGKSADAVIVHKPPPLLPKKKSHRDHRRNSDQLEENSEATIDLTADKDSQFNIPRRPVENKWMPEPIKKNLRNTELEMQLQKIRFSGGNLDKSNDNASEAKEIDLIPRKVCIILDPSMNYYDEQLAKQCRFQILSESNLSVNSCTKLLDSHWTDAGKDFVYNKKDGSFMNQMLFVVMPSSQFLFENVIGDNLQDNILSKEFCNIYENNSELNSKLTSYVKNLHKHFKSVKNVDSKFNSSETKYWLDILSKAEANIENFATELKEDLATLRCFQVLRNTRTKASAAMQNENENIHIKEEKDTSIDFDFNITGEDVSVVFAENIPSNEDRNTSPQQSAIGTNSEPLVDCPINCLVELISQQIMKNGRKEPITIDLEDGEMSDEDDNDDQNKENKLAGDFKNVATEIREFIMRRLFHEQFILHEIVHIQNKFREKNEDKSIAYTDYASKWLDKSAIKRALSYVKKYKIIKEKSDVSLVVSSVFQCVKLFNCLARTSWLFASASEPLLTGLHDCIKEEGEVEEGEAHNKDDREMKREERKKRKEKRREDRNKREVERKKEEETRLNEMEELKQKLQEELASMGVDMDGENFDNPEVVRRKLMEVTREEGEIGEERPLHSDVLPEQPVDPRSFIPQSTVGIIQQLQSQRHMKRLPPSLADDEIPTPFAPPVAFAPPSMGRKQYPVAAPFYGPGRPSRVAQLDESGALNSVTGSHQSLNTSQFVAPAGPQAISQYPPPFAMSQASYGYAMAPPTVLSCHSKPPLQTSTCKPKPDDFNEKQYDSTVASIESFAKDDSVTGTKTTAPTNSVFSSLRRAMNARKKLGKSDINDMLKATTKKQSYNETAVEDKNEVIETVTNEITDDLPNTTTDDSTIKSIESKEISSESISEEQNDANNGQTDSTTDAVVESTPDWFASLQSMWGTNANEQELTVEYDELGNEEYRNKGGYLMLGPTPNYAMDQTEEEHQEFYRKRKPRKRNAENELRKAAFSNELAPEDRIGPNADLWRSDQKEYLKKMEGKRGRDDDEEELDEEGNEVDFGNSNKKVKKDNAKMKKKKTKMMPIPYKRYILDNDPFREFLYNYKPKEKEAKRKLDQLKKQKKVCDKEDESNELENKLREEYNKYTLRNIKLSICSFVVRVSFSPPEFHIKWAQDIAHVFGMPFAPIKDNLTGAWLFPSNEGEDASSLLHFLKSVRLADAEINSALHFAAAPLPRLSEDSQDVLKQRLKLFREKYDNTIARNMQEAIENDDSCNFFRGEWRNAYLGNLKCLYIAVGDLVRSLGRKQASGGRKWCSEGVRGVVVVPDVEVAIWCGCLIGTLAGKRGVSLVGGEEIGLSDVEHADIVVGTPGQLLPLLNRRGNNSDDVYETDDITNTKRKIKHLLTHVSAIILDDVHRLMEQEDAKTLIELIKNKSKKNESLEIVATSRRIRFDELESAEQSVGCKFPRTALEEPKEDTETVLTEAIEEQLMDTSTDNLRQSLENIDNIVTPNVNNVSNVKVTKEFIGPKNTPYFNAFNKRNINKANYRNNNKSNDKNDGRNKQGSQDTSKQETEEENTKERNRERDQNEREENEEQKLPKRRLTFLEELDVFKSRQKKRKLEEGGTINEEVLKRQKKEMEKKMITLKEEQKKRLEEERKAAFEEKKKRREAEAKKRRRKVDEDAETKKRELEEEKEKIRRDADDEIEMRNIEVEEQEKKNKLEEDNRRKDLEENNRRKDLEEDNRRKDLEENEKNDVESDKRVEDEPNKEEIEEKVRESEEEKQTDDAEEKTEMDDRENRMRMELIRKLNIKKEEIERPAHILTDIVTHLNKNAMKLSEKAKKFNEKAKKLNDEAGNQKSNTNVEPSSTSCSKSGPNITEQTDELSSLTENNSKTKGESIEKLYRRRRKDSREKSPDSHDEDYKKSKSSKHSKDKKKKRSKDKKSSKSSSESAMLADQMKKLEQRKQLEEEKRKLEDRIQHEIFRRQKTLKSDEIIKQEKERKLLQEKLYQQQRLLQNKLLQEKKKKKKLRAENK